ncbi:MAG TPA: alpha/beta fold hydrolase [Sphingobacteriaceae bacterium]
MRNLYRFTFLIAFAALLISACSSEAPKKQAKKGDKPLVADILIDSLYPAGLEEIQFNSSGDTIFGFQYLANGRGPHPTVVLLHGLPGNERNLDIAQHLRRNGYNVVFFDYRGSWGSEGKFSFENCIGDTRAVIDHITDPANHDRLRIDTKNIFLVGHSMGAGLALINGINDDRIKGAIGVSVFNPYTLLSGRAAQVNLIDIGAYVSKLGMLKTTPESFLKGILSDVQNYNIEQLVSGTKKPILVIDEHKLNEYFKHYNRRRHFDYEIWNTDHAFTDKRLALAARIERWLDSKTRRK